MLNIYFNSSEKKKAELSVYDLSGRKLFTQFVNASEQSQQLNLPVLSPGIYLVVVNNGKHTAQQKLVVMK
ncbi:MAG: T9SS type A sorting domain-containing protein [Bacteroidetes bacterium]|nr:T9SS type A sorting domain-containing protein [Bacteroidota bacterium]